MIVHFENNNYLIAKPQLIAINCFFWKIGSFCRSKCKNFSKPPIYETNLMFVLSEWNMKLHHIFFCPHTSRCHCQNHRKKCLFCWKMNYPIPTGKFQYLQLLSLSFDVIHWSSESLLSFDINNYPDSGNERVFFSALLRIFCYYKWNYHYTLDGASCETFSYMVIDWSSINVFQIFSHWDRNAKLYEPECLPKSLSRPFMLFWSFSDQYWAGVWWKVFWFS